MPLPLPRIDEHAGVPAYRQIAAALRAALVGGAFPPGSRLPAVRQVALELGVHFNTVAQAYRLLAGEGWLNLKRRRGALVVARKPREAGPDAVEAFPRRLREMVALWRAAGIPPSALARELRLVADSLKK